jgi:O-antigen/teichoic acid export membrane protein
MKYKALPCRSSNQKQFKAFFTNRLDNMPKEDTLKSKAFRGAFWSSIDSIGTRLVQLVIGIVLARLLLPSQFGLIAMLAIFMAVAQSLLDSGFGSALIQKKEITELDTNSVFFFNLFISVVLTATLFLLSPLIADFYKEPELNLITKAMSFVIIINAFSQVQSAILSRELNFKFLSIMNLVAGTVSGLIGISLAFFGFGVWSLVLQQLSTSIIRAILLWFLDIWRPKLIFSYQALKGMYSYGSKILASGLIYHLFENLYFLIIAKLFGSTPLGYYSRALSLSELPPSTLSGIISRVSFPVFSSIQDDNALLKSALKRALHLLFFVNLPIMIGLIAVSDLFIKVLLTEKWTPCVPYLRLLCVLGILFPLHILNLNVLMAKGRSDLLLRLELLKKSMVIVNLAISWQWGIIGIICGQISISFIAFFLNSYYTWKLLDYDAFEQMKDLSIYLLFGIIMAFGVSTARVITSFGDVGMLSFQILVGITIYGLLSYAFKPQAFIEGVEFLSFSNVKKYF